MVMHFETKKIKKNNKRIDAIPHKYMNSALVKKRSKDKGILHFKMRLIVTRNVMEGI